MPTVVLMVAPWGRDSLWRVSVDAERHSQLAIHQLGTPHLAAFEGVGQHDRSSVRADRDVQLVGVPQIVIVGRGAADGEVELWDRRTGEREVVPAAEVVERLRAR